MANKTQGSSWFEKLMTFADYLSSRDDAGNSTPLNFLYTTATGLLQSAKIGLLRNSDADGDTRITFEESEGSDEDTISLIVRGEVVAEITDGTILIKDNDTPNGSPRILFENSDAGGNFAAISHQDGALSLSANGSGAPGILIEDGSQTTIFDELILDGFGSGQLLTSDDGSVFLGQRFSEILGSPVGNNTTNLLTALTLTVDIEEAGVYQLRSRTITSINNVANDLIMRFNLDGSTELTRYVVEHKDSAGVGIVVTNLAGGTFNTGTDQRVPYSDELLISLPAGTHTIDLDVTSNLAGAEPTIYEAQMILERWS